MLPVLDGRNRTFKKADTRVLKRGFKKRSRVENMLEASLSIGRQRVGAF